MLELLFFGSIKRLTEDISKACVGKTKEACRPVIMQLTADRLYDLAMIKKYPTNFHYKQPSEFFDEFPFVYYDPKYGIKSFDSPDSSPLYYI